MKEFTNQEFYDLFNKCLSETVEYTNIMDIPSRSIMNISRTTRMDSFY